MFLALSWSHADDGHADNGTAPRRARCLLVWGLGTARGADRNYDRLPGWHSEQIRRWEDKSRAKHRCHEAHCLMTSELRLLVGNRQHGKAQGWIHFRSKRVG